ncbi:hypothetical protein CC85DRAFT_319078 [Cutaneotrichosporon oleaginosum]|uniref:Amino acid transporter transmembrane domain-containing protein n=1 Tax=Cutaneotrichosporon oleaginosum TaxID=879819 RepID=A0A0J0XM06_9TREE|nr:uncharacterized protein CC85DRAFT_319078 [Cutaneotrichosporon oleaginosum]KLT42146.1 hypothetical protein CC85DRAFT_319078 [Cutaneotrichosporon oleaginosum]TXT11729.1 hypothetical protein COLE_02139 [Cutaneotrichosporon oleaginosum]
MVASINAQPIEVYLYYARQERTRENADTRPAPDAPWSMKGHHSKSSSTATTDETLTESTQTCSKLAPTPELLLTEPERETTYRLLRVASWQVVFYLITTDMLGWFTASKAFAQIGYGPGALVYTCFFIFAFAGGQMLWRVYMNVDSEEFPVRSYADLGERTYGPPGKFLLNTLQALQLLFNVGMFIVMQGQALAQIIDFKFCYIALNVFFALAGMLITQIRTIRNMAWLSNINVFVNLSIMFVTAIGIALYDPVPGQSGHVDLSEPIRLHGWLPPGTDWHTQVAACQLAVFSYGGAMIFVEFIAEMRRPADFWKAALCAQFLCYATYMFFGIFGYSMQGQYSAILPTVNMANIAFQAVTNIIGMFCVFAIVSLYAHVGCKLVYRVVLRGYFRAPSLTSRKGGVYWALTVLVYYCAAWALGSAIPNINDINVIVGAVCALQFTFTFPPLLLLGHWMQVDAAAGDVPWEPGMEPYSNRIDAWGNWSRWKRGMARWWFFKLLLLLQFLGSLTLAGLGIYSGVRTAKQSYRLGATTAYSCRAPGQPIHR